MTKEKRVTQPFTEEERLKLGELLKSGCSIRKAARDIGRSIGSVSGFLFRNPEMNPNLPSNSKKSKEESWLTSRHTKSELDTIIDMWERECQIKEIADFFNVTYQAMQHVIRVMRKCEMIEHRRKVPKRHHTAKDIGAMKESPQKKQTKSHVGSEYTEDSTTDHLFMYSEHVVPSTGEGIPFINLSTRQCRFPLWSSNKPRGGQHLMLVCGKATDVGFSYCREHDRVCVVGRSKPNENARSIYKRRQKEDAKLVEVG